MNLYATLNDLKALLRVDVNNDEQLIHALETASRQIEKPKLTGRYFYSYEGTRYYDGAGSKWWLPEDILSISDLNLDQDGDGVYETPMLPADYILYPLNEYPKIRLEINPQGNYSGFASGIPKGIEITGVFGYADSATPYDNVTLPSEVITLVATSFAVTDASEFKIGQTIRCEDEQMFITDIGANILYVIRGINGTTTLGHTAGKAIAIYHYPADIVQATLIIAMRAWKRKDSAFADIIGAPETGQIIMSKGIDPDVVELVAPYKRQGYV